MFKENKYSQCYWRIINRVQASPRNKLSGYFENHHVLPKCLGGTNDKDNLVLLTAKEHYLCHYLLCRMVDNPKILFAFGRMQYKSPLHSERYVNSRMYAEIKPKIAEAMGDLHRGKVLSAETRRKIGDATRLRTVKESTLAKLRSIALTRKGIPRTAETKQRISEANTGNRFTRKPFSEEHCRKLSERKKTCLKGNNTKPWIVTIPDGTTVIVQNRREFCEQNNLNFSSVKATTGKLHKGYLFIKLK